MTLRLTPLEQLGAFAAILLDPDGDATACALLVADALDAFDPGPPRQALALVAWYPDALALGHWSVLFEGRSFDFYRRVALARRLAAPAPLRAALAGHVSEPAITAWAAYCAAAPLPLVEQGRAVLAHLLADSQPIARAPQDVVNDAATAAFLAPGAARVA